LGFAFAHRKDFIVLLAQLFVNFFQLLTYLLVLFFFLGVVPYAATLIQDEWAAKSKPQKPKSGHHRWGMKNANNLAQKFLEERRYRETETYKIAHHAIAGKRA
jgi:hypothetical protein